jgi:hypothetical protein
MNTLVLDGTYVVTSAMSDAPASAPVGALVRVQVYGTYTIQEYKSLAAPLQMWRRIIRPANGIYGAWAAVPREGQLAGKKIVCFGDSITEAGDYPERLALRTGATVIKAGFGGCRMAGHSSSYYDPFSMYRLSERIADGSWSTLTAAASALFAFNGDDNRPQSAVLAGTTWSTVEYAVILVGTNDFSGDVAIGSASDTTGATFKGAINLTVENILAAYPAMKLLFVTPLWRARDGGSEVDQNANGNYLADYADAILERAGAYKIEALDLFRTSGVNLLNYATYLADELHPTTGFGYQHLADKISAALESRF